MVITYHGGECVKITSGDKTLAFNPPAKSSSLKSPSFGADIVFVSLPHPDFNGVEQVTRGDKTPFVINGPGEYEVADVLVKGIQVGSGYDLSAQAGAKDGERLATVYLFELEGIRLCFLGPVSSSPFSTDAQSALEGIDVLFVPIGDEGTLTPAEAHKTAVGLSPAIIIPIHHEGMGAKDSLKTFLKEEGSANGAVEKLTLKKKDLEGKEGEVVVLAS